MNREKSRLLKDGSTAVRLDGRGTEAMGIYLNPENTAFQMCLNSRIYVDKTMAIDVLNSLLCTSDRFICVSRPRRFGKTMALNMLSAYYGKCESAQLFDKLKISKAPSYREHLNKYNVLRLNMLNYYGFIKDSSKAIDNLISDILEEFSYEFPSVHFRDKADLRKSFEDITRQTGDKFIILIDEWDGIFRNYPEDKECQKEYLDFLRDWFKDQDYIALVYMTGILPIRKYGTHSALNMFTEFSITNPGPLAPYFGFTEVEVKELSEKYKLDFAGMKSWYDGYELSYQDESFNEVRLSIYNPKSVVEAIDSRRFGCYWVKTESFEALEIYFRLNLEGLKDDLTRLLSGEEIEVHTFSFPNTMTDFRNKDDVFTLLIHLGYLTFTGTYGHNGKARVPNMEIAYAFKETVRDNAEYKEKIRELKESNDLLKAITDGDETRVARGLAKAHGRTSIKDYNSEAGLKYAILLSMHFASLDRYDIYPELPAGKGFADVVYIPKPGVELPAILMELKYDKTLKCAVSQIKERQYVEALDSYSGRIILCSVNYDRKTKEHQCQIEALTL